MALVLQAVLQQGGVAKTLLQLVLRFAARHWYKGDTAIPALLLHRSHMGLRYGTRREPTIQAGVVLFCNRQRLANSN